MTTDTTNHGLFGPGIFGTGIDLSALDEHTALQLGIFMGEQLGEADRRGRDQALADVVDRLDKAIVAGARTPFISGGPMPTATEVFRWILAIVAPCGVRRSDQDGAEPGPPCTEAGTEVVRLRCGRGHHRQRRVCPGHAALPILLNAAYCSVCHDLDGTWTLLGLDTEEPQ